MGIAAGIILLGAALLVFLGRGASAAGFLGLAAVLPAWKFPPGLRDQRTQLAAWLRWTRASYTLLSGFLLLVFLILYVWQPLVAEYLASFNPDYPALLQIDWLLVNIFLFMSLMIMSGADLKADLPIILIGLTGGLVIESWGTQTELWSYYTLERPPLWIIPAWPIASLSIDRIYGFLKILTAQIPEKVFTALHWILLPGFFLLMLAFTAPTLDKSLTLAALAFCVFLILTPTQPRAIVLTFAAGSALGYYLELWGTSRLCWTYYTFETPPVFAVFAHGMAAAAFWRALEVYRLFAPVLRSRMAAAPRQPLSS